MAHCYRREDRMIIVKIFFSLSFSHTSRKRTILKKKYKRKGKNNRIWKWVFLFLLRTPALTRLNGLFQGKKHLHVPSVHSNSTRQLLSLLQRNFLLIKAKINQKEVIHNDGRQVAHSHCRSRSSSMRVYRQVIRFSEERNAMTFRYSFKTRTFEHTKKKKCLSSFFPVGINNR